MSVLITTLRQSAVAALGVAGAAGYNVSAAQVDATYSQLANQLEAAGTADATDRAGLSGDWANALLNAENKGSFFPAPRLTADGQTFQQYTTGYWTTQAYADQWDRLKNPNVEQHTEAPKTVLSVQHVQQGLVPLTQAEREAFDEAVASGKVSPDGMVSFSFALSSGTSSAPSSSLPAPKPDGSLPAVSGPIRPGPALPSGSIIQTIQGMTIGDVADPMPTPASAIIAPAPGTLMDKLRSVPIGIWALFGLVGILVVSRAGSRS